MASSARMSGAFSKPWSKLDESDDRRRWEENLQLLFRDVPEAAAVPTGAELPPLVMASRSAFPLLPPEPQVLLFKQTSVTQCPVGANLFQKEISSVSSQQHVSVRPMVTGVSYSGPAHITSGSRLYSCHVSYVVHSILGEGTYGKVAKCTRKDTNSMVAVKIIKNDPDFIQQAKDEVAILNMLRRSAPDPTNLVQFNNCFFDRGHFCLEFELLDMDLSDLMKQRAFRPLPLKEIRPIVHQLASALQQLKTVGIIHGDLQLENIMIMDHVRQPARVKIIDFGLACHVSAAKPCANIQSREYRSPEVMLGLPFSVPADMWSLGCIAAFLFLGSFLYYGMCEYEMMRLIVETQGYPPDQLLKAGMKTGKFFYRSSSCANRLFRLKTPAEYHAETGFQSVRNRRFNSLNDLQQFKHPIYQTAGLEDTEEQGMFVYMLKAMLELEASRRISPRQVLQLPFFSMYRTSDRNAVSSHYQVHHHITSHPCNSNQTQSDARAVMKMTRVEDETERADHLLSENDKKRVKVDLCEDGQRNGIAGLSTSSTQTQSEARAGTEMTRVEDKTERADQVLSENDKKRARFHLHEDGQRDSKEGLPTSSTQADQTAVSTTSVNPTAEGSRVQAEPQALRVSTQAKPKASSIQARILSPRTQLWYSKFLPEFKPPCLGIRGPSMQNSSMQSFADRGGMQKVNSSTSLTACATGP